MSIAIKAGKVGGSMPGMGSIRPIPRGAGFRGDPGFFGDLWGGIKGAVGGALTGNPLNIIGGAIRGATGQKETVFTATPQLPPMMTLPTLIQQAPNGGRRPTGVSMGGFLPGGVKPYAQVDYAQEGSAYQAGKASSPGYHWNKTGYFLKDGTWVEKGSREVKNRRRNPLNPRALDRSMSRITSAKRASKKLGRITIRKAQSCR